MEKILFRSEKFVFRIAIRVFCLLIIAISAAPYQSFATPEPLVAIHVSELTQALETMPAIPPTPTGSGFQWWYMSWHYFVAYESLKEALRSDGTPFVEVGDSDIAAGKLRNPDGSPRYPILISLASEAIADNEIAPLRDYVNAGGFLFVGSSAFTRKPDGTNRGDFALAAEMGLHMANSNLAESNNWNWYENLHFAKKVNHRLVSHIPDGTLTWTMPNTADEIPWGTLPTDAPLTKHYTWSVVADGATVVANGDSGPYLTVRNYGQGQFIYHGAIQPIIGHGVTDPSTYAYFIYHKAIEWAFESLGIPIVKLSPWRYPYDAALLIRHDGEIFIDQIKAIKASAQFEHALGAKGDYYFCTGALRTYTGTDKTAIISSLRDAVSLYGATIGSHNGGLGNPNPSVLPSDYYYWHWGPDEALDLTPVGYANGKAYASASILASFRDVEGWLAGRDNGRTGCGATGTCPRTWVAPYFNSTREDSKDILEQLGSITMGEEKVGPFPHFSLSYKIPGKRFTHVSLPTSDWYVGTTIPAALEMGHTWDSIRAAVDFYYDNGGLLLNYYGHEPSANGQLEQEYVTYSMSKPRVWATNAVGVYDWWLSRSKVKVVPGFTRSDNTAIVTASISGATDADTAIEVVLPKESNETIGNIQVFLDGTPANSSDYRDTGNSLKVLVGASVTNVQVQYLLSGLSSFTIWPATTVPSIAAISDGQPIEVGVKFRSDVGGYITGLRFYKGASNSGTHVGNLWTRGGTLLASATFANETASGWQSVSFPTPVAITANTTYVASYHSSSGYFAVDLAYFASGGVDSPPLHALANGVDGGNGVYTYGASGFPSQTLNSNNYWVDVVFSAGAPATLQSIAVTPANPTISVGGTQQFTATATYSDGSTQNVTGQVTWASSNTGVATISATGLATAVSAGTSTISASYGGVTKSSVLSVTSGSLAPVAANDAYSTNANTALNEAAPGVLGNDTDPEGAILTAQLVSGPSHGTLTLNTNGSFTYNPAAGYAGSDSFTYKASNGANTSNVATVTITVLPVLPTLGSITTNPTNVSGGQTSQGTVTLSGPAPSGGAVVQLSSDNTSAATVPASVTVPSGSSSATFTISTTTVTASTPVVISAVYGGVTKTATLTVNPPVLSTLSVSPTSVTGGQASQGTVTLSGPAPSGGAVVSLSDNSTAASEPVSVTVPGGSTSATFTITTTKVFRSTWVTISAVYSGLTRKANLRVTK